MFCTTVPRATLACFLLLPLAAIATPADGGAVAPLSTVRVAGGLNRPIFVTHVPGDETRLFIVEQRGVIKILDLTTETVLGTAFLNIDSLVAGPANNFDERGLLSLAFHPDFAINGFFYVNYTNNASNTTVARYTVSANPNVADSTSAQIIIVINQPQSNHNGGWIAFGPNDGFLYIGMGDGGGGCDQHGANGNGQDITNNLLGAMLRIDPSTTVGIGGYTNPPSNPFVGVTGDDEIWAYGLRNPWRSSFDRETGDLYIADVGQNAIEEINFQPGTSNGRENYGWRCFEGNSCSSISGCSTTPCGCSMVGLTFPIHTYTHAVGFSITGGYVYRGCDIPSLDGTYFFADFATNRIWSFLYNGSVTEFVDRTSELSPSSDGFFISSIASFGEDARGEVYIVDRASTLNSEIFRIIRDAGNIADFDCDGMVGIVDFLDMLGNWGPCPAVGPCPWDLDRDGMVGIVDFLELLGTWGSVP
ncbi:MAG: PQQ-dependent sugar dehydrogenase [Planctomycetes bacterium]|nr:PQQ-dependent sugar dehydrogenase [Planctomycetota bacterium]